MHLNHAKKAELGRISVSRASRNGHVQLVDLVVTGASHTGHRDYRIDVLHCDDISFEDLGAPPSRRPVRTHRSTAVFGLRSAKLARERIRRVAAVVWAVLMSSATAAQSAEDQVVSFPFGVYEKSELDPATRAWRENIARIVDKVSAQGFNTLVTQAYREPGQTLFLLDRAQQAGLQVIQTIGNPHNVNWDQAGPGRRFDAVYRHPAILAYKFGDEPASNADIVRLKEGYRAIEAHYAAPVVTAMVGEAIGRDSGSIPVLAWKRLQPRILVARYYPYRRTFGLGDTGGGKAKLPFVDWCAQMEALAGAAPWWYVSQGLGNGRDFSAAAYWRLPTEGETSAMVHVALAHGARGILAFALQPAAAEGNQLRLLDDRLRPVAARDGSRPLDAYGTLARLVSTNAGLLSRHRRAGASWTSSTPAVIAVARIDPADRSPYLYVVNLDGDSQRRAVLKSRDAGRAGLACSVYGGPCLRLRRDAANQALEVELAPGEGRLYRLHPESGK